MRSLIGPARSIIRCMGLLYFLADTFINTFGITQPTENARKQAAFFILALTVLAIGAAVGAFVVLHAYMK